MLVSSLSFKMLKCVYCPQKELSDTTRGASEKLAFGMSAEVFRVISRLQALRDRHHPTATTAMRSGRYHVFQNLTESDAGLADSMIVGCPIGIAICVARAGQKNRQLFANSRMRSPAPRPSAPFLEYNSTLPNYLSMNRK